MPELRETVARLFGRRPMPHGRDVARLDSKASLVARLIGPDAPGDVVWSPRDYASFAREGFMQNAVVYRSVRMVAEAAATIPLLVYDGDVEVENSEFGALINQPNGTQTGTDLFESWYGYLLVAGNAYLEAVSVEGRVRELHALRPDRMRVVAGTDGWPAGYDYTAGGRSVRFQQDGDGIGAARPILHVKMFHPANDHYGMSPIEAAAAAIDIHNTASGWNKALLDNSARPSGALVYGAAGGNLTDEQFSRLKSELEDNYQGAAHAGRPMLLEGGLDWKPLSLSPKRSRFCRSEERGGARDCARHRRAAAAARHSGRQHVCELCGSQSRVLAPNCAAFGAANGGSDERLAGCGVRRWCAAPETRSRRGRSTEQ